ncbi:hypothetical protein M9458_054095, partial [Cirrhinus mrigala]
RQTRSDTRSFLYGNFTSCVCMVRSKRNISHQGVEPDRRIQCLFLAKDRHALIPALTSSRAVSVCVIESSASSSRGNWMCSSRCIRKRME